MESKDIVNVIKVIKRAVEEFNGLSKEELMKKNKYYYGKFLEENREEEYQECVSRIDELNKDQ